MELTLEQALQKGVEAHKAGKAQEADMYYTAILKANPKHSDANHNMGVLGVSVGKVEAALPFFKTALETNPSVAQYWLSYIDALIKLNRMTDAKAVFDQAKSQGAKGDAFDQIEKRLIEPAQTNAVSKENINDPAQEEVQALVQLFNQRKLEQVFEKATLLTKQYTDNFTLWNLLGASAAQIGKLNDAVKAFQKAISIKPGSPKAYNNMGNVLQEQGKLREAVEAYEKAISLKPDYAEAYNNKGNILKEQDKFEEAIDAYNNAILHNPNFAEACNNLGNALQRQGRLEEAIRKYNKAISLQANYAEAHYNMGNVLQQQGQLEKAVEAYKKAISLNPQYTEAYNNMGSALQDQGTLEEAMQAYNSALAIEGNNVNAWSNGAEALEKWNKLDRLDEWLDEASRTFKLIPADIKFIKSKLLWRKKKYKEASSLIFDIEFDEISEIRRQDYLNLKGKYFDKSNEFEHAYDCFGKSNSLAKASPTYLRSNPDKYFESLKEDLSRLKLIPRIQSRAEFKDKSDFNPIFLVGFPRSGTTLLDTILRSHSKIEVVEEQPSIQIAQKFIEDLGHNVPTNENLPLDIITKAKEIYTREFNKHIDTTSADKIYIDKLPLNLLHAPLINQLYPNAKFILALRHPMDTILSCWMQNFKLNAAMANMVDLDRLVDFYCIAMETFKICRTNYNLNVYEIRYEDLINNFQKEAEAVVQFLNLQWEPEMENYQDTAIKRGRINTPSYSQVVQPIYKDAQYRWLNYKKYLEQYLEQVKLWISEFGYD